VPASLKTRNTPAFSQAQRKGLAKTVQAFSLATRQKGTYFLINSHVENFRFYGNSFSASVRDVDLYQVKWKDLTDVWCNECTCSSGSDCKHAYAAAHYALQHGTFAVSESPVEKNADPIDHQIDRLLSLVSNNKKTSSPSPAYTSLVSKILDARSSWDAMQFIPTLLTQLGIKTEISAPQWTDIFQTNDREKRAWLLARGLLKLTPKLPTELEPYRRHEVFEKEETVKKEHVITAALEDWIEHLPSKSVKPQRSIVIRWSWDNLGLSDGPKINLLVSNKKLKEVSRTLQQMRNFIGVASRSPNLFSAEDADFLQWLDAQYPLIVDPAQQRGAAALNTGRALHAWLTAWGHSNRCVWEDGQPVAYNTSPAQIVPQIHRPEAKAGSQRAPTPLLGFAVELKDGTKFPLTQVKLILPPGNSGDREPIFVFANHTFYLVQSAPPTSVLLSFLQGKELPLSAKLKESLLPRFLRRFPRLIEDCHGLVHHHAVQTQFSFSLRPNDLLSVRLLARSKENRCCWELTHDGWVRDDDADFGENQDVRMASASDESSTPSPNKKLPSQSQGSEESDSKRHMVQLPNPADTEPAQQWLETLGLQDSEGVGIEPELGWFRFIDSASIDSLLESWKLRPSTSEYWVNAAFSVFVDPSRQTLPRLRVNSSGMDWFSISSDWEALAAKLTASDLEKLRTSTEKFIKVSDGRWITKEQGEESHKILEALFKLGLDPLSKEPQRLTVWQMVAGGKDAVDQLSSLLNNDLDKETHKTLQELKAKIADFKGVPDVPIPNRLRATMRAYQVEGLKFLSYTASLQLGAVLADDMGLGKTLQSLAWLEHIRDQEGPSPCLVVCPASVVYNWQREAEKFIPGCKILLLTSGEERHELRKEIPEYDIVITNYALLRRDLGELKQFKFRAVILDEAQNVKNPDSQVARAAKQLSAVHRLALTGTPLENRLLDLWSIVDFIAPGYLGTRTHFTETYDTPDQPHRRQLLTSRLRAILLRRIKREVAPDLPDRIEERQDCELTEGQRLVYLEELQSARKMVQEFSDPMLAQKKIHVLAALTRLRQICCHPSLVGAKENTGSGKTSALMDILEPLIAGGHKVLVFSQFVRMLNLLEGELNTRSIPYHLLTGQTTKREAVVEGFQHDPRACVFLLSLKAAGTGLNLTAASYVVLYDPWWNPAVEAQAIDRTHRIGQDRTVITYRLVAKGTVEDKIYQLQQQKAAMVRDVLGEEGFARNLTRDDLNFLFQE
jgi:hypothetical protein